MSSNSVKDLNEFFGFVGGLVVGLVVAIIAIVIVSGKMEDRIERSCLIDQEVGLNGIMYACELQK